MSKFGIESSAASKLGESEQNLRSSCDICDKPPTFFTSELMYCPDCDYWFSNLPPFIEDTTAPDAEYELTSYEHTRSSNYKKMLNALRSNHPSGSKLLEIGCADGLFLKLASEQGYQSVGIEPNVKMINRNPFKQQIEVGYFPSILANKTEKFDIIVLNDVLEHIPNINNLIEDFKRYLNPSGTIAINVPVASGMLFKVSKILYSFGMRYPFERHWQKGLISPHLHFFSTKSIGKLFARHGLNLAQELKLELFSPGGLYSRLGIDPSISKLQRVCILAILYLYYPVSVLIPDSKAFFFRRS